MLYSMQTSHFALKLLAHSAYNHRVGQPMADRNVVQKSSSFLKRKAVGHATFGDWPTGQQC